MHLFEADQPLIKDLKEEAEILQEHATPAFTVVTARHPTLGKLVIVHDKHGDGLVVETEA